MHNSHIVHSCICRKIKIQLTTDAFIKLPGDDPVMAETCNTHWNEPIIESYLGLFN
jgi:hypothetical protein